MPQPYVSVWDGKFIQFREYNQAVTDALAGLVQIFAGPRGWLPGWQMADSREFPLAATPAPTLASIAPTGAEQNTGNVTVTLTGTNFNESDQVYVDGVATPSVVVNATTATVVVSTAGAPRAIPIKVADAYNRETAVRNFTTTATPPP
jgi:hypothetical protein